MPKNLSKVHVPHNKNTANMASVAIVPPKEVLIPTSMHSGSPAVPVVNVGDHVYVGTLIAKAGEKISAPVHASISGTVTAIEPFVTDNGRKCEAIRIEGDGKMESDPNLKPVEATNLDEWLQAVNDSGAVGLGGAAFPTWAKFNAVRSNKIETMLVNGAECEPFITSDTRTMIEDGEAIKKGVELLKEFVGNKETIIGIEKNKPECIANMKKIFADDPSVKVNELDSIYPQGAKQTLLYSSTGKVVEEGQRLAAHGVLIINVTSLAKMATYFMTGMPLVDRIVTVDGSAVKEPKNLIVPIGTSYDYVIEQAGGLKCEPGKVIVGGPMMGQAIDALERPVIKATNAVLVFNQADAKALEPSACIHCGRCVDACPLRLNPAAYSRAMEIDNEEKRLAILDEEQLGICMECGCCAYVCPAHRPLVKINRDAKAFVRSKRPRK